MDKIKNEIQELLNNRELPEEEVTTEIHNMKESRTVEFDTPGDAYEVFADYPRLEQDIRPDTPDEEIAIIATEAAEKTIPYMHPWDAYQFLTDLRDIGPAQ